MVPRGSGEYSELPVPGPLEVGGGRTGVVLQLRAQGRDLVLTITGGAAHVGAVAVDSPAGGTGGEAHRSLTVVPGHKEGPLAESAAIRLAAATGRTVVAVVGIHQDRATAEEIASILQNVECGLDRLIAALHDRASAPATSVSTPGEAPEPKDRP